jgi:hypothetical protein
MSELEEKLSALMSNPQLMQQIASMAQAMGGTAQEQSPPPRETPSGEFPVPDPRLLQFITQAAGESRIDTNQKALLQALSPYLSSHRVEKLERAMKAARLADTASAFLNSGGLHLLSGR